MSERNRKIFLTALGDSKNCCREIHPSKQLLPVRKCSLHLRENIFCTARESSLSYQLIGALRCQKSINISNQL